MDSPVNEINALYRLCLDLTIVARVLKRFGYHEECIKQLEIAEKILIDCKTKKQQLEHMNPKIDETIKNIMKDISGE